MVSRSLLLLAVLSGAAARTARAQDAAPLDPTVAEVTTGGHWAAEGKSGSYRVIIRSNGGASALTIEWLAAPTRSDGPTVVRSEEIKELNGLGRIDRPRIGQYLKGWRVWLTVTDTHADPSKESSRSIDVGAPGDFKVVGAR